MILYNQVEQQCKIRKPHYVSILLTASRRATALHFRPPLSFPPPPPLSLSLSLSPDLKRSLIKIRSRLHRDTLYVRRFIGATVDVCIRARTLHFGFDRWSRVPTHSRRDTYESSRFAIYAITAARRRPHQDGGCFTRRRNGRFALMHERCHAPFRPVPSGFRARSAPSKEFSADAGDTRRWHFAASRYRCAAAVPG